MSGSAPGRTAPANSKLVEIAQHARENLCSVRTEADVDMEATDVDAVAHFDPCGQNVRPVTSVDGRGANNLNFVSLFEQSRVLPGERLGSADHTLMTTLNDDCDFAHNSPLMAVKNPASIFAFVKFCV